MAKKKPASSGHKNKLIGLRLAESLRLEVQALADAERRSLASMSALLLEAGLKTWKKPAS